MKTLTISNGLQKSTSLEIQSFFKSFGVKVPDIVIRFISSYGGTDVLEYRYKTETKVLIVNNFLPLHSRINASIELILPTVRDAEEGIGRADLIPFAVDPGGNPFYVSIGSSDYSNVYIDTLNSRGFTEPILKIANSFEEFIDGLQPEEAPR